MAHKVSSFALFRSSDQINKFQINALSEETERLRIGYAEPLLVVSLNQSLGQLVDETADLALK